MKPIWQKSTLTCFLSVLLTVMLAASAAAAASLDAATLSDTELLELYRSVKAEIDSRGLSVSESISLREGQYIIGEDIPAGSYTITCTEADDDYRSYTNAMSGLSKALGDEGAAYGAFFDALGSLSGDPTISVRIVGPFGAEIKSFKMKLNDTKTIVLNEGTAISISDGSCTLDPQQ